MRHDVVVTGMGVVTSLAASPQALFDAIARGGSGIRRLPAAKDWGYPNPHCAYIDIDTLEWETVQPYSPPPDEVGLQVKLAVHAAAQAYKSSGLEPATSSRAGVFAAANVSTIAETDLSAAAGAWEPATNAFRLDVLAQTAADQRWRFRSRRSDAAATTLAETFGMRRCAVAPGDACAAGGIALGTAFRHIRHGELDVALAGGTEAMCHLVPYLSFSLLGAVAPMNEWEPHEMSRPFDRSRNGFLLGEGSAFVVLESLEHARRRGAPIRARISGFAKQCEAWRPTSSDPDGSRYETCMRAALADANLTPADVDHVNAHGTSTVANDRCEAVALKRLFGSHAGSVPITANKSALGHTLAASGAIEAILSTLSIENALLLPTANFTEPDDVSEGLDVVRTSRPRALRHVLSNSFGFGGENCCLIISHRGTGDV